MAPDGGSGGWGAGAERGEGVLGLEGGRCVGGGGDLEGLEVKFKAWPGPVQAEGRGAQEGIRVWQGCEGRPESF